MPWRFAPRVGPFQYQRPRGRRDPIVAGLTSLLIVLTLVIGLVSLAVKAWF